MKLPFRTAVTVCLVPQASQGPFVFHGDPENSFRSAKRIGFDAVELFLPSASELSVDLARRWFDENQLHLAAVGTGAGWILHQYSLTSSDKSVRFKAIQFVKQLIDWAGHWNAPAIIGSMQGRHEPGQRDESLDRLANALHELSLYSQEKYGTKLLYEPLNRYETNLWNRLDETSEWLAKMELKEVRILADLFHMNIEEANVAESLRRNLSSIGHVHWADSNRSAMGLGHTDANSIFATLVEQKYTGYLSAEVLPLPTSEAAATQTLLSIREAAS